MENLPNSIKELYLDMRFNLELNNLPNSIKIISFANYSKYNKELNNLPNSVKVISFDEHCIYDKELNNLPYFLEKIHLPLGYNKEIKNINSNCKIQYK